MIFDVQCIATWSRHRISPLKLLIIYSILMPRTFPMGQERTVFTACVYSCYMFVFIELPREEICAFSVGVISAFCLWEPVCYGDEIVPSAAAAQPPPQPQ